jgi:hypothetical protein
VTFSCVLCTLRSQISRPYATLHSTVRLSFDREFRLGSLDGLALTGMGAAGVRLLQAYLDRTGDIQVNN